MPELFVNERGEIRHSDDMQDIITAPPGWLLRWGITLFFGILVMIVGLSALIKYPDIVKTQLKVSSMDAPKSIVTKVPGKLNRLLIQDNQAVVAGQPLAYLESTANHQDVLALLIQLQQLQQQLQTGGQVNNTVFNRQIVYNIGELQPALQTFSQSMLTYQASVKSGFYEKKKGFLQRDLINLDKQKSQLTAQKTLQQRDFKLAGEEYEMNKKLEQEKAETPAELRAAESKYLSKQSPLVQTDASLITAGSNYDAKQKEILELDNQMMEEKAKFVQALNSLISQAEDWKNKYVLSASQNGKLSFAGIIQQNQVLQAGQEVFYINPGNNNYFGEMAIPQANMGKVKENQEVLIKLHSYPFEEYGMIRGRISNINEVPYKDSVFLSRVSFNLKNSTDLKKPVHLKQGMLADAEIITEDATILQRITRNLFKLIGSK
ncbi:HlyD family efflux transporter periplasmic adaptor subunit [uncultured Mucilaginibacter sp.]|uniref:HlyD family secretion protein n=1 Tax=uncultured Mucilaginibacter sp. TaxID=797541 RepID=UPI0026160CAB|nr:HlyD family efflux transporter periplasmic adaptor subunit [uncultured Mucilaginibacter sp.]